MLTDDGDGLCYALKLPGSQAHVGLRRDSLGSSLNSFYWQFPNQIPDCSSTADVKLILDRWKVAPFVVEPYGNGSSPTFPCETFDQFQSGDQSGRYNCSVSRWDGRVPDYCIDQQVLQSHIADIKNSSLCSTQWSTYPAAEQQAFLYAGQHAGYRLGPAQVAFSPTAGGGLSIQTDWRNTGVAPTYDAWTVEFLLRQVRSGKVREVARWISSVDLRQVLPTGSTPYAIADSFDASTVPPGTYELAVVVLDPRRYLNPMHLALESQNSDGSYDLGMVSIPGQQN